MSDQEHKSPSGKLSDDELEKIGVAKKTEELDPEIAEFDAAPDEKSEEPVVDSNAAASVEESPESAEATPELGLQEDVEVIDDGSDQVEPASQTEPSTNGEVLQKLASISGEVKKLATRDFEQLERAKKLIYTLSGITSIVLIASITFFVVMASSVSQKIGELDRVLMAVAKRGIQLADGIETVTEMEVSVLELMDQNSLILADISSTQEKIESLKTEVERLSVSNLNRLSEASDKLLEAGQSNLSNVSQRLDSLDAKLRANDEVKALLANQKAIETQVRSMKNVMVKLDENVKDLYVIRQAEVESIYQDLMNRQSIED